MGAESTPLGEKRLWRDVTSWPPQSYLGLLPEETRQALLDLGIRRVFSPGQVFVTQGDLAREIFVIVEGVVRVESVDANRASKLIDIQARGDTVGEMAALEGAARSASVSAAQKVVAIEISADDFLRFAENDSAAARGMMRMLSIRQRVRMHQTLDFNQYDAGTRLARTLVALAEKCGVRTDEGISLDEVITQADLAPLVGASEPGIHKALRPLREDRIVETGRRRLMIRDLDALRRLGKLSSDDA
jgi:CRP-like cAMP-binding protein